jgi:hypothetical protein
MDGQEMFCGHRQLRRRHKTAGQDVFLEYRLKQAIPKTLRHGCAPTPCQRLTNAKKFRARSPFQELCLQLNSSCKRLNFFSLNTVVIVNWPSRIVLF